MREHARGDLTSLFMLYREAKERSLYGRGDNPSKANIEKTVLLLKELIPEYKSLNSVHESLGKDK